MALFVRALIERDKSGFGNYFETGYHNCIFKRRRFGGTAGYILMLTVRMYSAGLRRSRTKALAETMGFYSG